MEGDTSRGGFSRGFSRGGDRDRGDNDRGRGRGRFRNRGRGRGQEDELKNWVPVIKLGRLVISGKITSLEEIYLHSIPIKEYQIIDFFYQAGVHQRTLKDEVMKVMPVQQQTRAGQRTCFKAFVIVGDEDGHIGLGVKCSKEVATAIRGAIIDAKLNLVPVRRGYWGDNIGDPHTVPMKLSGKCGSVRVRLIPAPRGAKVVGAPTTKKILQFAGVQDCFSVSCGKTKTRGNFMMAIFNALASSYGFLTPNLWRETPTIPSPFEQWSEYLAATARAKPALKSIAA